MTGWGDRMPPLRLGGRHPFESVTYEVVYTLYSPSIRITYIFCLPQIQIGRMECVNVEWDKCSIRAERVRIC